MSKYLFIASSSRFPVYSLVFKDSLNNTLKNFLLDIQCVLWEDEGVFQPGYGYLETLAALKPHYAVALITPDDKAEVRGTPYIIPRDNVIFEYGLFLGKLGREKTFLVTPENEPDLQIMSDLHGVSTVRYQFLQNADIRQASQNLQNAVFTITNRIFRMEHPPEPPEDGNVRINGPFDPTPPILPKVLFPAQDENSRKDEETEMSNGSSDPNTRIPPRVIFPPM